MKFTYTCPATKEIVILDSLKLIREHLRVESNHPHIHPRILFCPACRNAARGVSITHYLSELE